MSSGLSSRFPGEFLCTGFLNSEIRLKFSTSAGCTKPGRTEGQMEEDGAAGEKGGDYRLRRLSWPSDHVQTSRTGVRHGSSRKER